MTQLPLGLALVSAAATAAILLPGTASADSHDDGPGSHIKVDWPSGSPGHKSGGQTEVNICPFESFDQLRGHFDGPKGRIHDKIDAAFEDAIKIDDKIRDDAFDQRHKRCGEDDGHHKATQTKVVPKGSVDAGDGSTDD